MRPGKPSDLRALRVVMKRLVREGIVNCVPNAAWFQRMLGDFDWAARSRVVEQDGAMVAGVLVFDRPIPEGTLARAEIIAGPELLVPLADWGIALSRASAAWGVQVWRGRGHGDGLERTGLARARRFWRMDRPNLLAVPALPLPMATGCSTTPPGRSANRSGWTLTSWPSPNIGGTAGGAWKPFSAGARRPASCPAWN